MMGQCKGDESEQRCLQGKFNSTAAKRKIKCNETMTTVPIIKKRNAFLLIYSQLRLRDPQPPHPSTTLRLKQFNNAKIAMNADNCLIILWNKGVETNKNVEPFKRRNYSCNLSPTRPLKRERGRESNITLRTCNYQVIRTIVYQNSWKVMKRKRFFFIFELWWFSSRFTEISVATPRSQQ